MRMIIEAHLVDDEGCAERVQISAINRESTTDPLAMKLAYANSSAYQNVDCAGNI